MLAPYARSETVPEARHLVEWILPSASTSNTFLPPPRFLGMTSRHANRIIRQLEEFGPGHFELAQLTRIRREAAPQKEAAKQDRVAAVERHCEEVLAEIRQIGDEKPGAQRKFYCASPSRRQLWLSGLWISQWDSEKAKCATGECRSMLTGG
jgi:hypothetical protein